jgi:hypothetical protein
MGGLSAERDRMLRTHPQEARTGRNHYWWAECPKHGLQAHLSYLEGRCERCQVESLKEKFG